MIVIYTTNIGFYDFLRPPKAPQPNHRYICFTDWMPSVEPPWEAWPVPPVVMHGGFDRGRTARAPKILPHLFFPDAEASIYHDANRRLEVAPEDLLEELGDLQVGFFAHPGRECLYDEARVVVELGLEEGNVIRLQTDRYRHQGYPTGAGLWAGGLIIRRHTLEIESFNKIWWYELLNYAQRDQVSLPYALWKSGLKPHTFPGDYYRNPSFSHEQHATFEWAHSDEDKHRRARCMVPYWELLATYGRDPSAWAEDNPDTQAAGAPAPRIPYRLRKLTEG